jgi:hypothetical protein
MGALSSAIRTLHYCLAPLRTARASANVKSVCYLDFIRQYRLDANEAAKLHRFTIVRGAADPPSHS